MTISPGNFEATNQEPTNNDLAKDQKEMHEQNPDVREFPRRAIAVFYADTIGEEAGKEDHAAFNEVFSFMSSDIREKIGYPLDQIAATPYGDRAVYDLCRAYVAMQYPLLLNSGRPQPGRDIEQWLDQSARLAARGNPDQDLKVRRVPADIYTQLVDRIEYQ